MTNLMNFTTNNLASAGATNLRSWQSNVVLFKFNGFNLFAVQGSDKGIRIKTVAKRVGEVIYFGKRDVSNLKGSQLKNYLWKLLENKVHTYTTKARSFEVL